VVCTAVRLVILTVVYILVKRGYFWCIMGALWNIPHDSLLSIFRYND
jgi:hypothetical protein